MLNKLLASIHQQAQGIKTGPQKPLLAPSAQQVRYSKLPLLVAILQRLRFGGRLLVTRTSPFQVQLQTILKHPKSSYIMVPRVGTQVLIRIRVGAKDLKKKMVKQVMTVNTPVEEP